MDIEKVLQWAYREELGKSVRESEFFQAGEPRIRNMFDLFEGPRGTATSAPLPASLAGPHPDALRVEAAVRDLANLTVAEIEFDLAADFYASPADQMAAVSHAMLFISDTVAVNARLRSRPALSDPPRVYPLKHERGQIVLRRMVDGKEVASHKTGRSYPEGTYSVLQWDPRPEFVLADRAIYATWWAMLVHLAETLADELESVRPTLPGAAQRPWAGDEDAKERLLPDLVTVPRAPEPPRRPIAAAWPRRRPEPVRHLRIPA